MTIKSIRYTSILLGAIALTSLLPAVSLATPQTTAPSASTSQPMTASSLMEQLKLTDKQKSSIRTIRANRTRQINNVLTQKQKTQLQSELKSGRKLGESIQALNLSTKQKNDIMAIVRKSNQEIKNVLTPTQQQQLAAYFKQRHQSQTQTPID